MLVFTSLGASLSPMPTIIYFYTEVSQHIYRADALTKSSMYFSRNFLVLLYKSGVQGGIHYMDMVS